MATKQLQSCLQKEGSEGDGKELSVTPFRPNDKLIVTVQACCRCGRTFRHERKCHRCPRCQGNLRDKAMVIKV